MQHFFDFINSSKFNEQELSDSNVVVSLKVDGTSLQIVFDNDNITFHKRGKDDITPGPKLTQIDAFTNHEYFTAMKSIFPDLKQNKEKFQGVKMLCTEILSEGTQHFVHYSELPPKGICLLTATSVNDKTIKDSLIEKYAQMLGVVSVPIIFNGQLKEKFHSLKDYIIKHCDYHNPNDSGNFKSDILNILGVNENELNSSLFKTEKNEIEGFVFNFSLSDGSHTMLKVDSPAFMKYIAETNKNEKDDNLESIAKKIISRVKKMKFDKFSNNHFENLLKNFEMCLKTDKGFIDFMFGCSEEARPTLDGLLDATSKELSILPAKFQRLFQQNEKSFLAFRMFIWAFGKKKTGKNYPVMTKFNPFIEKMGIE